MNPQIQSAIQTTNEGNGFSHDSIANGMNDDRLRSQTRVREYLSNLNSGDTHTNHLHIQVTPSNPIKRIASPIKTQQVVDIQPSIIVQHQRPTSRPGSAANILTVTNKDPLNEAYIERENARAQVANVENGNTNRDNDSTSTLKQYDDPSNKNRHHSKSPSPPPSPSAKELNRLWKKQRSKYSFKTAAAAIVSRSTPKGQRPPGRLKNYDDDSGSESTATETPTRDDGKYNRF